MLREAVTTLKDTERTAPGAFRRCAPSHTAGRSDLQYSRGRHTREWGPLFLAFAMRSSPGLFGAWVINNAENLKERIQGQRAELSFEHKSA